MDTIANLKELSVTETPLVLFDIELPDTQVRRWSTHRVTVDSNIYEAKVLRHNFFEVQGSSDSGIDGIPRISFTLANSDSTMSQIESSVGFKGSKVTATFLFYDLKGDVAASEQAVVFRGLLNPPDDIRERSLRLSALNRMSMQRVLLPSVRIQRRCPWDFPSTASERQEAVSGGSEGSFSRFHRCGYSAGEVGGVGNLDNGLPFTSCRFTREDCIARGMFDADAGSVTTRRFGGIEFVPPRITVRGHREKRSDSAISVNEARYNDFVPIAYGTSWITPPVVFARNDGNLTRTEVLLGLGQIERIHKVVVNEVEIPIGVSGQDLTATGWWNLFADGGRVGGFNLNFTTPGGQALGDPYGSMAALSVVVPNQISDGRSLPRVQVLLDGLQLESFDLFGSSQGFSFAKNPAWILLDVLRRTGWQLDEIDLPSFRAAADYCDQTIAVMDNQGNPVSVPRFELNSVLKDRRSAADVIRGIRNNARLRLTYLNNGKLSAQVENTILLQQPVKPAGSNALTQLNGGWPAYVYTDGSVGGLSSGILRNDDDSPSIRLFSKPTIDTPNRFAVAFSDRFNEFQQDSLALVDSEDIARAGQELTGRLIVDGLPTFDQAARTLKFFLDKSVEGNRFIEFETSVKGVGQTVGDIISVTYIKEGLVDQPFRILRIEPGPNYRSVRITAQTHNDAWYQDTNGQLSLLPPSFRPVSAEPTLPDPLYGSEFDDFGDPQFGITEYQTPGTDGAILIEVEVAFVPPVAGQSLAAGVPIVSLQPTIAATGGTIEGNQTVYYAVTAVDADGLESNPSFVVRAEIPAGTSTNTVTLNALSFTPNTTSFNVYRGALPSTLNRIAFEQSIATTFLDAGLAIDTHGAPSVHYDHANFYWWLETNDELFASIFGPDSVGSSQLALVPDEVIGRTVRLIRGKGAGQERAIRDNDATTVFVTREWQVEPDASTVFVISNSTWHFGGRSRTSPARFQIPNRRDDVVQITGRSANAQNIESLEGLGIVTRWRIGGGGLGVADIDVPPQPTFGLATLGNGNVEFGSIGFSILENTQGIESGTFTLHSYNELAGQPLTDLAAAITDTDTALTLTVAGGASIDDLIQIDSEILKVTDVQNGGLDYTVDRAQCDTVAAVHVISTKVFQLDARTVVMPFDKNLFGTVAGGSWAQAEWMPSIRIACAQLVLTNLFGQSPVGTANFTQLVGGGLRTLHGGQFSFQLEGPMGVLVDAVPLVNVPEAVSIRDVFAVVKGAPVGSDLTVRVLQDGVEVTTVTILDGQIASSSVLGVALPVLQSGSHLGLDITAVGSQFPGSDLTVTVRV